MFRLNAVAPTKLKKALQRIATEEKIKVNEDQLKLFLEEYEGDVRAAVNAFQIWSCSIKHSLSSASSSTNSNISFLSNDSPVSLFHALGRVLYDKRIKTDVERVVNEVWMRRNDGVVIDISERNETDFDFNNTIDGLAYDPITMVSFLHENHLSHYESLEELSLMASYFSDVDILSDWQFTRQQQSHHCNYVSQIIGRASVFCNRHHSPPKFSPLVKPKVPSQHFSFLPFQSYHEQLWNGIRYSNEILVEEYLPMLLKIRALSSPDYEFLKKLMTFPTSNSPFTYRKPNNVNGMSVKSDNFDPSLFNVEWEPTFENQETNSSTDLQPQTYPQPQTSQLHNLKAKPTKELLDDPIED
jgi:hypothetical protein